MKHPDDQFTMVQQMPGKDKHLRLTMEMGVVRDKLSQALISKGAVLALNYHRY